MSDYGSDTYLTFPLHVDHDFVVDNDGVSYIVTFLSAGDEDEATEVRVDLEGVTDDLCEFYGDLNGYQHLYSIAHEFSRVAEKLRTAAGRVEDSTDAVGDLFNV
mgnify:FL=1